MSALAASALRRNLILEELRRAGSVSVSDIAARFDVSEVTIRSDLNSLAAQGALIRTRGGAVQRTSLDLSASYEERSREMRSHKRAIAAHAVSMVVEGETVILDGGTTTLEIARALPLDIELTAVTPSFDIAAELISRPNVELHLIGGEVNRSNRISVGSAAEAAVGGFIAHRAFIGANAIDGQFDVVDISTSIARLKRAQMEVSRNVVLVTDSSKFGGDATAKVARLTAFDLVVSDNGLDEVWRTYLDGHHVPYILAEPDPDRHASR